MLRPPRSQLFRPSFSLDISLNVVLMAVIGGAGTWLGPLIGAPLVLLVAEASASPSSPRLTV